MVKEKKIFVTGGTGFLGSYLLRYLVQQGAQKIRALRRKDSSMALVADIVDQIEWVEGDLLDSPLLEDLLIGVDQVYHCAGLVTYHPKRAKELIAVNETGTSNLVNALLYHGGIRLLHVSSIAAIGKKLEEPRISERTKWVKSPLTGNYAISKFLGEQQVWRGIAEGLEAVIINPSVIMGSGFWDQGTARFFPRIREGQYFYPLGTTGFVDVRDVAKMSIQLMESGIQAERFIANASNLSYQKFFGLLAQFLSTAAPKQAAGPFLSGVAWRFEWLRTKLTGSNPFLTKETALLAGLSFTYDNTKSIQSLNYSYLPIEETLAATAKQYLKSANKQAQVLPLV